MDYDGAGATNSPAEALTPTTVPSSPTLALLSSFIKQRNFSFTSKASSPQSQQQQRRQKGTILVDENTEVDGGATIESGSLEFNNNSISNIHNQNTIANDLVMQHIASYLNVHENLSFSLTCSKAYEICVRDEYWRHYVDHFIHREEHNRKSRFLVYNIYGHKHNHISELFPKPLVDSDIKQKIIVVKKKFKSEENFINKELNLASKVDVVREFYPWTFAYLPCTICIIVLVFITVLTCWSLLIHATSYNQPGSADRSQPPSGIATILYSLAISLAIFIGYCCFTMSTCIVSIISGRWPFGLPYLYKWFKRFLRERYRLLPPLPLYYCCDNRTDGCYPKIFHMLCEYLVWFTLPLALFSVKYSVFNSSISTRAVAIVTVVCWSIAHLVELIRIIFTNHNWIYRLEKSTHDEIIERSDYINQRIRLVKLFYCVVSTMVVIVTSIGIVTMASHILVEQEQQQQTKGNTTATLLTVAMTMFYIALVLVTCILPWFLMVRRRRNSDNAGSSNIELQLDLIKSVALYVACLVMVFIPVLVFLVLVHLKLSMIITWNYYYIILSLIIGSAMFIPTSFIITLHYVLRHFADLW